jgi:uncharacterized BrkB/YihY/UPF0761 family membrane protein
VKESDEPTPGLKGLDFALGMFATMFMGTSAVMDTIKSVRLGAASLVVTALGLWLLFRWLKLGRPQPQRFVGAVVIVALTLMLRLVLGRLLL